MRLFPSELYDTRFLVGGCSLSEKGNTLEITTRWFGKKLCVTRTRPLDLVYHWNGVDVVDVVDIVDIVDTILACELGH